jgi:2-dehydro-3-deoxy-D-gluconate 5-dehydrogenase
MILDNFRLDGCVALVTGATHGIGQACATALAEAGADVVTLSRSEPADTGEAITATGRRWQHIPADLGKTSVTDLENIVGRVVSDMGRLDILVNNAGINRRTPAMDFTESDWDDVIQVNLKSLFFMSQAAARVMKQQGSGKIIHIASLMSFQGGVIIPAYTAAKSGVAGLTRALANEWAQHHINVNAIAPGYIDTPLTKPLSSDPERNRLILDRIPAGRWGKPDDLKGAVVFLASAASNYMHGTIMPVDGGWLGR